MCECCKEIADIKEIESSNRPPKGIKHKVKARICSYSMRNKTVKGICAFGAYELNYCPMCGRDLKEEKG